MNSLYWLGQLELGFLLHVTESILIDRPFSGHSQCSTKIALDSFFYSPLPLLLLLPMACTSDIPLRTVFRTLELLGLFALGFTSSPGQALASPSTQVWNPGSLLGVKQTLIPPWDLYLCWASFIPYLTWPTHFPVSAGSNSSTNDLSTHPYLVSSSGEPKLRQVLSSRCPVLCGAHSVGLINVTSWFSRQWPSLQICLISHVKWSTKKYLAIRYVTQSNFRGKSREVI